MLTVPLIRQDFQLRIEGAMLLRRTVIDLMLAENGSAQASLLWRNHGLTDDQRGLIDALPPLAATRASLIDSHLACWRIFRPVAVRLMERLGLPYPRQLEVATLARLQHELGVVVAHG